MAADFYNELGVSRSASADEIKRAYRKLASKYHPDRNPDNAAAETKFKTVNRAHEVLSNPEKRKLYDEFGEMGLREGFNPNMSRGYGGQANPFGGRGGLEDLFGGRTGGIGDLFGDVFRTARGSSKGPDAAADVTVDFISAIRGANVTITVPGSSEPVTVRVPPGAGDGDKVRVAGHGGQGRGGGPAGDLVLTIRVATHPHFTRDGLDLTLDLPISVGEAFSGAKVRVPTPEGDVTLTIPAGTRSGQKLRLKGKGVKRQGRQGDLYVRFQIVLPKAGTDVDDKVRKAIETLEAASDMSARDAIHL